MVPSLVAIKLKMIAAKCPMCGHVRAIREGKKKKKRGGKDGGPCKCLVTCPSCEVASPWSQWNIKKRKK